MAYINVAEWTPDQVTDWLKGLDDSMYNYVYSFTNNEVGGVQLLNIRPYELEQLGMSSIGHQEIVLEAVENLRNFHYNLDKENLQFMALHVATASRGLHRQLAAHCGASIIETQILNDITRTIATIKPLIGWLDRAPFQGQFQFTEICRNMLRLGLEMATIAQRDRFVEGPVRQIRGTAEKLERLANYIIQDITDPMLLQPASLNLVTLKKRESELGFNIESSYHGTHRVTDIKHNSPAHNSGKIEDGDEIVQINYQTVVGWQYKTVLLQLRESLPDVLLTLKKRPKHTKIYGQIYMQPYRLPSKKRSIGSRWGENVPSPRPGYLTVPLPLKTDNEKDDADTDSICSDILTPTDMKATEKESRLYYPKPRAMLQRRNTICGDELLGHKNVDGIPLWHERKTGAVGDPASPSLRDKSVSFGYGLEITPRPTTCIGITSSNGKFGSDNKVGSVTSGIEAKKLREPQANVIEKSKPGVSKVVRFDSNMKYEDYNVDEKFTCNVENTILETFEPIPFADEEEGEDAAENSRSSDKDKDKDKTEKGKSLKTNDRIGQSDNSALIETVNAPVVRRGRLDKSHSTPAYDNTEGEVDTPPAIEPRKEFLLVTPPVPPPRPRKQNDSPMGVVPLPPPKPPGLMAAIANANTASAATDTATTSLEVDGKSFISSTLSLATAAAETVTEVSELHTPSKTRTLTLKKKNSLMAKRRNINLKLLGTGEIQGHLYRRTKDRRGVTFWARLYFVMLDTILYGFRCKDAPKASCVIFLPGFTVSLAKEVHSKPFAFKVYHSAKTFYFAAESQDALNQWVEFIRQSTLHPHQHTTDSAGSEVNTKELFSENDSSGEEIEAVVTKNLCTPSPQGQKDGSGTLPSGLKSSNTPVSSNKNDRRYLGSLRKLTKGTLPFKSSSANEKKASNDIPVPTDQYRSYRKVPGGSFGIQIGANTPGYHDSSLHPYNVNSKPSESTSQVNPTPEECNTLASSSSRTSVISNNDSIAVCPGPPSTPPPAPERVHSIAPLSLATAQSSVKDEGNSPVVSPSKSMKKIPYNFIHASNPNLVEFDFQTSKTLDYSLPKINSANSWDAHQNIQGFVTLKDLMLQKQEEEAQEMYNNRVLLGVERKDENKRNVQRKTESKIAEGDRPQQPLQSGVKVSKTQSRSLPKPPDYEISFKPDDEDIQLTRTKEGLKLRDFGYELISGDEPLGQNGCSNGNSMTHQHANVSLSGGNGDHHEHCSNWAAAMKSRQFLKSQQFLLAAHKNKKHSASSCSSVDFYKGGGGEKRIGSFKKKGKLESFKSSSERLFQFSKHGPANLSGMTMTLPLNKKSSHTILDGNARGGGSIKKSQTYNNDLKEKAAGGKYDAHRKNSAPMPIFSKFSFSTSSSLSTNNNQKPGKDKKLLGSPHLHRTVFGNSHNSYNQSFVSIPTTPTCTGREYDQEIFSQVIFPKVPSGRKFSTTSCTSSAILSAPETVAPPPPTTSSNDRESSAHFLATGSSAATPEYPNMECPPVFEPDIYSLSDPNASLALLLRRNNSTNNSEEKH